MNPTIQMSILLDGINRIDMMFIFQFPPLPKKPYLITMHQVKTKFVLVGIWNTIFGYGIFCLFDTLFTWLFSTRSAAYMCAIVLAQILAVINAYIYHKYITFKSEAKGRAIIAEFFRFSTTYVVTFCLSLVLLPALVEIGHIHPKISAAIIILICAVISYLGHSRFSLRTTTK